MGVMQEQALLVDGIGAQHCFIEAAPGGPKWCSEHCAHACALHCVIQVLHLNLQWLGAHWTPLGA